MPSIFVFDAYGTLFDVHAAIARFRAEAGPDADRMSEIWRTKQLEYTWTLTLAGHYADFWTLTERALDFALARVPSVRQGAASRNCWMPISSSMLSPTRARRCARSRQGPQDRASCPTARPRCSRARSTPPASAAISTRCFRSTR